MTPTTDPVERIKKALEAEPTDAEWICDIRHGELSQHAHVRAPSWGIVATVGLDRSLPHWDGPQRANAELIAACNPVAIRALLDRLEVAEREQLEQSRLLGMSAEREAALLARVESAERDSARLDHIEKNARSDPKMGGQNVYWPTTFKEALRGPDLRTAIDKAMKGQV